MERDSRVSHTVPTVGATYGPVYASDHSYIHQGDTYIGQDPSYAEYEAFTRSLNFADLSLREESIKTAVDGTFEWIFPENAHQLKSHKLDSTNVDRRYVASDNFKAWLGEHSSNRRFWIRGKAGSGKSTFMTFVSNHDSLNAYLHSSDSCQSHIVLRHYFWHLGSPLQRNLTGFLRSITWQFFAANRDLGFQLWHQNLKPRGMMTWSILNLTNVFRTLLQYSQCSFCLFIDGLDECIDSEEVVTLLHGLESSQNLKICISSRPERRYELAFNHWPALQLDQLTHSDMRLYAEKRLRSLFESNSHVASSIVYFNDLIRSLIRKAEGVFVWLCVVVQSLRESFENLDDSSILLQRVDEYPDDVHQLYLFILERHKSNLKRYNATGATIFKLLLRNQIQPPDRSLRLYLPYGQDRESGSLVLTRLAWARDKNLRSKFFASDLSLPSIEEAWKELKLETMCTQLPIHCGNFVEIADRPLQILQRRAKLKSKISRPDLANLLFYNQYAQFIHKTVTDFLTNQEGGRNLLSSDSTTDEELESAYRDADLIIATTYLILVGEASDKCCRVLISSSGDPTDSYSRWSLIESIIMKAFSDRSIPACSHCLLEQQFATAVPPRWDNGFLFYCIVAGRWDYLRTVLKDSKRFIAPRTLTDFLSMVIMIFLYKKDVLAKSTTLDFATTVVEFLKHGANPTHPMFGPHHLPGGQACPSMAITSLSLIDQIPADVHVKDLIADTLGSELLQSGDSVPHTMHRSRYKLALLYWPRRHSKGSSTDVPPKRKFQVSRTDLRSDYNNPILRKPKKRVVVVGPNAHDTKDPAVTALSDAVLARLPGTDSHLGRSEFGTRISHESEKYFGPVVLEDAHLRLLLWDEQQKFWLVLEPDISKKLLDAHKLLQEEVALGLGLPGYEQLGKASRWSDSGLIWLRLVDNCSDLIDMKSGLKCPFRGTILFPTLLNVCSHLEWPQADIDHFSKYCHRYHEHSNVDEFRRLTAKTLRTVTVSNGRLPWKQDSMKLYLRGCIQFARRSNARASFQPLQVTSVPTGEHSESVDRHWNLTSDRTNTLSLDDFLLKFLSKYPSFPRPEALIDDVVAHTVSSNHALFACSTCHTQNVPCFGIPSAAKGNSCMMCYFEHRPCSFDVTGAASHRLTTPTNQSLTWPMVIRNLRMSTNSCADEIYCWFEGVQVATVVHIISSVTPPVGITSQLRPPSPQWVYDDTKQQEFLTSVEETSDTPKLSISATTELIIFIDRFRQILNHLCAFTPRRDPSRALHQLARAIAKGYLDHVMKGESCMGLLKLMFDLAKDLQTEHWSQQTTLEILSHSFLPLTMQAICKTFILFNNGLCAFAYGNKDLERTVSCGNLLVVANHDFNYDSILLSEIGSSSSYAFVTPLRVPGIQEHVPEWEKADIRLFTIMDARGSSSETSDPTVPGRRRSRSGRPGV